MMGDLWDNGQLQPTSRNDKVDAKPTAQQLLLTGPKIGHYTDTELLPRVSVLIRNLYVVLNFKIPDTKSLAIITSKLTSELYHSYSFLTFEEVSYCFDRGGMGDYGDYVGLSIRTYCKWLKAYVGSDYRYRLVTQQKQQQTALPSVSASYNRECEDRMLQLAFKRYRENYPLDRMMPGRYYRILQERGLIHDSRKDKMEAMARYESWHPANNLPIGEELRKFTVKTKAMTLLLSRFFDNLISMGYEELPL